MPKERGIAMSECKGRIYDVINRIPRVNNEEASEVQMVLREASEEFPDISKYYVESKGGSFRYEQFVYDVQKWQKKWLGSTKR